MSTKIIGTWRMSYLAFKYLKDNHLTNLKSADMLEKAIEYIENHPLLKSVGYGGLPNNHGEVECDAAFMNGDTLAVGALAGAKNIANPIKVARKLASQRFNIFLVGSGADQFAIDNGFEIKNMLTEKAKNLYVERMVDVQQHNMDPYDGHDTVGMICLDQTGTMIAGTSTSGLFMKQPGRIGDSALSGSGFYVDSQVGGVTATGLGEDLMKGCLSYDVIKKLEADIPIQQAMDETMFSFHNKLKSKFGTVGAMSIVGMDKDGNWGVASNVDFTFCVLDNNNINLYLAKPTSIQTTEIKLASSEYLSNYLSQFA